ncbi:DUF6489 family protein [Sphingomonas sp. DT-51]|uniref:DUF6489 family protein n=1 Tax=Sphingomonas sp. DT-51 TaxID=3396165 RepID=UPI003F1B6C4F
MKVTIELDCTPEEARRMMGLPDLTALHDLYLAKMRGAFEGGVAPEAMASVMRSWAPMNDAGIDFWRQLFASPSTKTSG